jgi:tetratricopeptide (TPR) repeat protein
MWLWQRFRTRQAVGICAVIMLGGYIIISSERISGIRYNYFFHDFGRNIAKNVEKNAVLMFDQVLFDEPGSTTAYYTGVLKKRTDMRIIALSGTMFENIYGDDYFDIPLSGRLRRRINSEQHLLETSLPVYIALMDKHANSRLGVLGSRGLVYKRNGEDKNIWPFYIRREYFPKRQIISDYPSRLVLTHYPYFEGKYYMDKKNLQTAARLFNECTVYGYDFEWLMSNLGSIYARHYDIDTAYDYFTKSLMLDPFYPDAYFGLGYVCLKKQEYIKAKAFLQKCIEIKKDYENAYYNLGAVESALGNTMQAEMYFQQYRLYTEHQPASMHN